jgi:hypothetical protein
MFPLVAAMKEPSAGGGDTPATILGASLTDWFDARAGVTGTAEVTNWANQGSGGDASQATAGKYPKLQTGADGTAEITFPDNISGFDYTDSIHDELTAWILVYTPPSTQLYCLLIDESNSDSIWTSGFFGDKNAQIFDGSWHHQSTVENDGWHVMRFSVRDSGTGLSSLAVDDNAEDTSAVSWIQTAKTWTEISRTGYTHALEDSLVKQFIIADQFYDDSDSEHDEILAYFKALYPSLVTY